MAGILKPRDSDEGAVIMDLLEPALKARERAYAPYSGFRVGAALRCGDGSIHVGCNVENAAFPEGTCAEAGAIAAMVAAGRRDIVEVLVVADGPDLVTPCGGCRQRLIEFAPPQTPVILADLAGERQRTTVGDLLPGAFVPSHLDERGQ
jgi:cytidine deaminase